MPATAPVSSPRVFLSCVSSEFGKDGAPFPGLRPLLRHYLARADCHAIVQEDFPQTPDGTVTKLDGLLRPCAAVIHLIGEKPGAIADAAEVAAFLAAVPDFLSAQPALRAALGDFSGISYTQWEAYIALHRGVPLFVYDTPKAAAGQQPHLDRLLLALPKKYASRFTDSASLLGQLIGDLRTFIPAIVKAVQHLAPPRFLHHAAEIFLGRGKELTRLDTAWTDGTHVLSLIAWGGVGKTALIAEWVQTRFMDAHWLNPAGQPDPLAYFDWSFYDQGTRALADGTAARTGSVGDFFEVALGFFGDENPNLPGKGARLAGLVRRQRTLLILDGLEPLQQPPGHPQAGRLLDPDLRDLLCALALANPGLCLLTSRQALTDLDGIHGRGAQRADLDDLPKAIAVRLLRRLQITGTDKELTDACEKFGCHALSLTLLGRFLFDAHGGDIARADRVNLHRADDLTREERHRTAWRVLEAYDEWLSRAKADGNPRTLAVLRLTGLFDRTATADCLAALRAAPVIPGLTDAISSMDADEWNILLRRLERAHLLKLRPAADPSSPPGVDAHPLVREYFAEQLQRTHPHAFRDAHSRLFDHLCNSTEHQPDTLLALQPLYQAVTHGCLGGRHQEACDKVYVARILRGMGHDGFFSTKKLGAIGADLGAVVAFFTVPWSRLSPNLTAPAQAWLLSVAAFNLRALGRLTEAIEPMRAGMDRRVETEDWNNAAISASNRSELEVTLGLLSEAVADGRRAIAFADRSDDAFEQMSDRTTAADALHQAGDRAAALDLFAEAERMQVERQPEIPLLYSLSGFRYADLLLAPAERAAWKRVSVQPLGAQGPAYPESPKGYTPTALASCDEATRRAEEVFRWRRGTIWNSACDTLIDIALDHLTLARAALYRALLTPGDATALAALPAQISQALTDLRETNMFDQLPKALLTAAFHAGTVGGQPEAAERYLAEAQLIAERGPMPLYLADVHLHRARLFGPLPPADRAKFPHLNPRADLAEARRLIEHHGYARRKEELEDAEAAAGNW